MAPLARIASRVVRALIGAPTTLPPELADRYPELARARYRRGGLPPRIGGWALGERTVAAITLWRTIFLAHETRADAALLLHELRHMHQFEASRLFPVRYLWASLRRGYRRNPYELDAEAFATRRLRTDSSNSPSADV